MKEECNCALFTSPNYHASDNPHSVEAKFECPVHGKQERYWLVHEEKQKYCKPCRQAPNNIAATQVGDEPPKVFTYEGSAFEAPETCLCRTEGNYNPKFTFHSTKSCYWEAPTDESWEIEKLSSKLHDIYQKEAHRQEDLGIGSARHYDEYEKLSEPVKEFDRVLARYIIDLLQKEREKAFEAGLNSTSGRIASFQNGYNHGKSEGYLVTKRTYEAVRAEGKSEALEECSKLAAQQEQRYYDEGKSEAFSLVRYAIAKLKSRKTNALQESYEQHVLDNLLSTLKDK